jgi:hypothetical protein
MGARSGSFLFHLIFLLNYLFSIWFLTISSSGTIMVTSGTIFSFRMHPVSFRNIRRWSIFCNFMHFIHYRQVQVFHWFPCSGPSRVFSCPPWRLPRTISTDSPDFEFSYINLMLFIYGQTLFSFKTGNSCPQTFLEQKPKKPYQFAYTSPDKKSLERIPSCAMDWVLRWVDGLFVGWWGSHRPARKEH